MAQQLIDQRDLDFVLWEQFENEKILENKQFKAYNKMTCNLLLKEARKIAINEILPTLREGDIQGVTYKNGEVTIPDCFGRAYEILKKRRVV